MHGEEFLHPGESDSEEQGQVGGGYGGIVIWHYDYQPLEGTDLLEALTEVVNYMTAFDPPMRYLVVGKGDYERLEKAFGANMLVAFGTGHGISGTSLFPVLYFKGYWVREDAIRAGTYVAVCYE